MLVIVLAQVIDNAQAEAPISDNDSRIDVSRQHVTYAYTHTSAWVKVWIYASPCMHPSESQIDVGVLYVAGLWRSAIEIIYPLPATRL